MLNFRYSVLAFGLLLASTPLLAQLPRDTTSFHLPPGVQADFIALGRVSAAIYRPTTGTAPHIGFIYINGGSSALSHPLCSGLAKRGFLVLCSSSRMESGPANVAWEGVALDEKTAMDYLRAQPGITAVILVGHSGGGANASFYQAVAENGVSFCQGPGKLSQCSKDLAGLRPADAIIFPDAHPGLGIMSLRQTNPSVTFTADGTKIDPALDPYNPANGFNPTGPSHYSLAFQKKYFAAQAATIDALIDHAVKVKAALDAGTLKDPRENIVQIPSWSLTAHLDILDPTIPGLMQTAQPRKLMRNDGTIVTQVISSVEPVDPNMVKMASGPRAMLSDGVTHFLGQGSIRATDSLDAIDYCSSNSSTVCNVRSIHVPVFFLAMGASSFIGDDERMYERSPSKDKDYLVVEGANHGFTPCTRCETTPGQYSHALDNTLDAMRDWANKRF